MKHHLEKPWKLKRYNTLKLRVSITRIIVLISLFIHLLMESRCIGGILVQGKNYNPFKVLKNP
jgi:hypothetical protein